MARDSGPCALSFAQGSFAETISFPGMSLMADSSHMVPGRRMLTTTLRIGGAVFPGAIISPVRADLGALGGRGMT